ncbi:hypothetical protein BGZ65_009577 [Modicella reniformis]|uniref:C2H2-type domain-containing protein n=1 Tax=Modicella reniformis TaxID=1440133 RepID=A0A9P6INA4_9FUNG|nr:hypothetical protein BGZ65_009577 [Modicella reniformis]
MHLSASMSSSEADTALQQQSKRLAGLSITNSTGAKVSILNDNSMEPESSSSPHSPSSQENANRRDLLSEEHAIVQHHSYRHQQEHYQYHQSESNFEAGRSSSLTNASKPMYSTLELAASQRSRSLSGSTALSPVVSRASSSASVASPTYPYFSRSYSEDNQSDDSESYRGVSDLTSAGGSGTNCTKRKYSCSFPGCHKVFTTSGHLARHNRIHTGERNFACLMPGCPSKFSRQDNMMQHYRTHISPKSRRGTSKKHETQELGSHANNSQETLGQFEHSPNAGYYNEHEQQHSSASRQDSRQNSPSRFGPTDRSSNFDYSSGRHPTENHANGGTPRHKGSSGLIQTHQHHTPMPHFNVQAMGQTQAETQSGSQGTLPSPLTPTIAQPPGYHHQPSYMAPVHHPTASRQQEMYGSHNHAQDTSKSPNIRYRSDAALASPTSPMTQDVERMEGVESSLEHDRSHPHHSHQQQQHRQHQSYQNLQLSGQYKHHYQYQSQPSNAAHAGHAHANPSPSAYQLPPLSLHGHGQERRAMDRPLGSHLNAVAPPSPQSTPHTPTKYRFDPIQDCLQQDKHQQHRDPREHRDHHDHREHRDLHYEAHARFAAHYHAAAGEDEDMPPTGRSSDVSSASSMTSNSSSSSGSLPAQQHQMQPSDRERKQESGEEMSGLAHFAQIVTTYGLRA